MNQALYHIQEKYFIKKYFIISIFITGIVIIVYSLLLDVHFILPLGLLLAGTGLVFFPSLLIALLFGGYYLFFLALDIINIDPYTNLTALVIICQYLLALVSVILYNKRKRIKFDILNSNIVLFIVFITYIFINCVFLSETPQANRKLIFLVLDSILPFFIGIISNHNIRLRSFRIMVALALILGFYTIIQVLLNRQILLTRSTGINSWDYLSHIYYLSVGFIILASIQLFSQRSFLILGIYVIVLFFNIILTLARGPVLSLILVTIMMLYYFRKKLTNIKYYLIAAFILVILISLLASSGNIFMISRFYEQTKMLENIPSYLSGEKEGNTQTDSIAVRAALIREQYSEFLKKPIFGIGFANTPFYVHNMILEALFETGIIGLILFVCFIYQVWKGIKYIWSKSNETNNNQVGKGIKYIWLKSNEIYNNIDISLTIITFIWFYFLIAGLFSGSIFANKLFWYCSGVIINNSVRKKRKIYITQVFES